MSALPRYPGVDVLPMTVRFWQPTKPLSLNEHLEGYRRRARVRPWRAVAAAVVGEELDRKLGLDEFEQVPVVVTLTLAFAEVRGRDPHNYIPNVKAVVDGCVDAGIVPDDVPEWLSVVEPVLEVAAPGEQLWATVTITRR